MPTKDKAPTQPHCEEQTEKRLGVQPTRGELLPLEWLLQAHTLPLPIQGKRLSKSTLRASLYPELDDYSVSSHIETSGQPAQECQETGLRRPKNFSTETLCSLHSLILLHPRLGSEGPFKHSKVTYALRGNEYQAKKRRQGRGVSWPKRWGRMQDEKGQRESDMGLPLPGKPLLSS